METKTGAKNGTGCQDVVVVEKTGSNKPGNRKSMTLMHRQYASLQTDNVVDKTSTDSDSLSRSCSSTTLGAMKQGTGVGDFKSRTLPRVQTNAAVRQEGEDETPEVADRSRSRISAAEGTTGQVQQQPQQQQQQPQQQNQQLSIDVSLGSSLKGPEKKSPKSAEKDDSTEQSNISNTAVKRSRDSFVKHFPEVAATDDLLEYYYCAYSRDILFPGFMYVTQEWICFHSKIMGRKDIRISVQSIASITKARTAKLIPNAICIATHKERHVFASLVSRDRTYSLLMKIWKPQPKPEDDDSLNGGSQNGERNYVNDDVSISSDDVTPSGSDESPYCENRSLYGSRDTLTTRGNLEAPDVSDGHQHVTAVTSNCATSHDSKDQSGKNSESSPVVNSHDRRSRRKDFIPQIHSVSSTTVVLTMTTILVACLILSAGMLAMRLIQLQAQMEATLLPLSTSSHSKSLFPEPDLQDEMSEEIYHLKQEHHLNAIQRLHTLLEIHLKLLDKVNQSLKGLQQSTHKSCSDLSAEEYTKTTNI